MYFGARLVAEVTGLSDVRLLRKQTLELYDVRTGRRVRSWPLDPGGLAPPKLVDANGGFAVYVAGIAIHLVRLSDGKDLALLIDGQADTAAPTSNPTGCSTLTTRPAPTRQGESRSPP